MAAPLAYSVPVDQDGEFVVALYENSSHRKIIIRDNGDNSVLWDTPWSSITTTNVNGLWTYKFVIPKTRVSQARAAKLAGKSITIELWLRHTYPESTATYDTLEFGLDIQL